MICRFLEVVKAARKRSRRTDNRNTTVYGQWVGVYGVSASRSSIDIRSSHPLERIPLPAPLNHVPHTIRDFRMNRPRWPVILGHRKDHCCLYLPGEDPGPAPVDEYLEFRRHAKLLLNSHASIPNANMSVALVPGILRLGPVLGVRARIPRMRESQTPHQRIFLVLFHAGPTQDYSNLSRRRNPSDVVFLE
jgi:hypothetical protein